MRREDCFDHSIARTESAHEECCGRSDEHILLDCVIFENFTSLLPAGWRSSKGGGRPADTSEATVKWWELIIRVAA